MVSFGNYEIWPVHSFQNDTICFDERLNVHLLTEETSYINPVLEFELRSFRFRDGNPSNIKQQQDITCSLMLGNTQTTMEQNSCECYSKTECGQLKRLLFHMIIGLYFRCTYFNNYSDNHFDIYKYGDNFYPCN